MPTKPKPNMHFLPLITLAMALPMLVLYAMGSLGPSLLAELQQPASQLGQLSAGTFAVAAVLSLLAGLWVERLGALWALCLLFGTMALAYASMAYAHSTVGLLLACLCCGLAQALANPATNLLIAQRIAPAHKAMVIGFKQSGVQMGALWAGLAMPAMAQAWGWRSTLLCLVPVAAALALWAGLAARFAAASSAKLLTTTPAAAPGTTPTPATAPASTGWRIPRPNALLAHVMATQACAGVGLSGFVTYSPTMASTLGFSHQAAGSVVAVFGAVGLVSRLLFTPWATRLRDESFALIALLLLASLGPLALLLASPSQHWPVWLAAVLMGMGAVSTNAIAMSMLMRNPVFGRVAPASAWVSCTFFAGFALGPLLCGTLLGHNQFKHTWLALSAVLALGAACAAMLWKRRRV